MLKIENFLSLHFPKIKEKFLKVGNLVLKEKFDFKRFLTFPKLKFQLRRKGGK